MKTDIILIGPIGAGKTTIGELLAQKLGLPQISMDNVRFDYYQEIGYDRGWAEEKRKTNGIWGVYPYWKPFEAHAVERLLAEHHTCVIDLGAGHSVYEDPALFDRVQKAFAPYPNVILLLPTLDKDESIEILNEREPFLRDITPNINAHFIHHPSNETLAKITIYTQDKTPEETCEEILRTITL
ncbi:MAG TPA: hypothetical protein PK530_01250 [Anaerolineales bacterium]|nr:hypothetical protein [Anaerolineales bacterium]